jgi:hypothetical protein
MASKWAGIGTFFEALAEVITTQYEGGQIVQAFEVGDDVEYSGSKVADHGHWVVRSVDDETNTVTLHRLGQYRMLKCNQSSVRHTVAPKLGERYAW